MSTIEWTDATWNPIRGCSRVSAGCENCYAERQAARFAGEGQPYEGLVRKVNGHPVWTGEVRCLPEKLDEPLRWRKPRRVFVNSMSDLFHESVPGDFIARVFDVMEKANQHTFQVLTKRPENMRDFVHIVGSHSGRNAAPRNVWFGVSVEDQATADERIPLLLDTPAAVRWVSYEPALGPVDFGMYVPRTKILGIPDPLPGLDWIVVGGESGLGARPCDVEWIRSVVRQCKAPGVPCFVKQLGAHVMCDEDDDFASASDTSAGWMANLRDRKGGDPSEWPEDLRVRAYPA